MSHGVNRGNIKQGKRDERENIINKIINSNKNIKINFIFSEFLNDAPFIPSLGSVGIHFQCHHIHHPDI